MGMPEAEVVQNRQFISTVVICCASGDQGDGIVIGGNSLAAGAQCSICRRGGGGYPPTSWRWTPHWWLKIFVWATTPPPSPDPASQFANYLCWFSLQHQFVAEIVSSFWDLWVELWVFTTWHYAKRGICRRHVSVRPSVRVCVCVCHTPILYQNG